MARSNIILYSDPASMHEVSWVVTRQTGRPGHVKHGSWRKAAKQAQGCRVTILVPASAVLISEVALPAMNKQRLLRAVPFALEEQLAADLDSLHFAIGQRYDSGELAVAVCAKEKIEHWLTHLKTAGLHPDAIVSDVYGIPFTEDEWTLYVENTAPLGEARLRIDEQIGMGVEVQNIPAILTILLDRLEPEQRPKRLTVIVQGDGKQDFSKVSAEPLVMSGADDNDMYLDIVDDGSGFDKDFIPDSAGGFYPDDAEGAYPRSTQGSFPQSTEGAYPRSAEGSYPDRQGYAGMDTGFDSTAPTLKVDADDTRIAGQYNATMTNTASDTLPDIGAANNDSANLDSLPEFITPVREICERMGVEGVIQTNNEEPLGYFAQHYSVDDAINILQGEFSRKEQLEKLFRPWIPAASIAAIWLFLQAGLLVADYQHLSSREQELRQQVVSIYKQAFPNAKNIVDPKRQMQDEIKKLKQNQGSGDGFISLLHKAGAVLHDTNAMTLKSIRYKSNKLDIDMEIADLQALDELKSRLLNGGSLSVEIVTATAKDGKVDSRIQIQPKTPS